jgi:NAD(P)H-dependent FMN reductase
MRNNIVIVVGSNGKNLELANIIKKEIEHQNFQVKLIDLCKDDIPLYHPINEQNALPQIVKKWAEDLKNVSAVVWVAPEYNGGVPPTITNFIAWLSRSGDDWRACFNEKKALLATHSGSGGLHLFMGLRVQLSYIGMNVLGRTIHTHYKKELNPESLTNVVTQLLK